MAALRRQRPVQLADVEFGGGQSDSIPAAFGSEADDRIKRQVEVAGQAYKKQLQQQQQQQQPQQLDVKDRYILSLESALKHFETAHGKLADQVLVQTKLVKTDQALNFAALLRRFEGLEALVASLNVGETQPEPETTTPEPALSQCLEHLLKEASREPMTLVEVDTALQGVTGQMLERLDRLEVVLNATHDHLAALWVKMQHQNDAGFERVEDNQNKTVNAVVHLEKAFNASQEQFSRRFDQWEVDWKMFDGTAHLRFDTLDYVINQTYALTFNQSAVIDACVLTGLKGKRFFGQWWDQFQNIVHGTVPENSQLYHAQSLDELFDSEKVLIGAVAVLFWLIRSIDGRGGSRLAKKWRLRQSIWHKAFTS